MDLDVLVKELQDYLSVLNIKKVADLDGDAISRLGVKLASLNSTLGQYVAQAEREASIAEMQYEVARERVYMESRKAKKTIADSDNAKRLQCQDLQEAAIDAKHNWRVMSLLRSDVTTLIDTLRSRLSYLKSDMDHS